MQNEKKKLGTKVKSLVSNYEYSDEEQDQISTEEEEEEKDEEEENKQEVLIDNEKNDESVENTSALDDQLNNQYLDENEILNGEKESFKAHLTIENGFLPGSENIKMPSAPKEPCSKELQDKIILVRREMANSNYSINIDIQKKKSFKNPSIYEKMIEHYDLDEFGSSFSSYVRDLKKDGYSYYDELDVIQRQGWKEKEKGKEKEKEKEKTTKTEIVIGTRKPRIENK